MEVKTLINYITKREFSPFSDDIQNLHSEIFDKISDSKILVIGGAGSIGSSTIKQILKFKPAHLHVIDHNENNLAELVRDLRGCQLLDNNVDLLLLPIDFGSNIMKQFLIENCNYDYVLNFAALKHVRSDKDVFSVLQMLNTNVLKQNTLIHWLTNGGFTGSIFSVSTDKAANPINLMGASKRLMELVLFNGSFATYQEIRSTRFANVAFSEGSLLDGFHRRLKKNQIIAVPNDIRRYFVSLEEAGQICLLANFCCPARTIAIPNIDKYIKDVSLSDVAFEYLKAQGYEPVLTRSEKEAFHYIANTNKCKQYPILLTEGNTTGEKEIEEFFSESELPDPLSFKSLLGIPQNSDSIDNLKTVIDWLNNAVDGKLLNVTKKEIVEQISSLIPEFKYSESKHILDNRI